MIKIFSEDISLNQKGFLEAIKNKNIAFFKNLKEIFPNAFLHNLNKKGVLIITEESENSMCPYFWFDQKGTSILPKEPFFEGMVEKSTGTTPINPEKGKKSTIIEILTKKKPLEEFEREKYEYEEKIKSKTENFVKQRYETTKKEVSPEEINSFREKIKKDIKAPKDYHDFIKCRFKDEIAAILILEKPENSDLYTQLAIQGIISPSTPEKEKKENVEPEETEGEIDNDHLKGESLVNEYFYEKHNEFKDDPIKNPFLSGIFCASKYGDQKLPETLKGLMLFYEEMHSRNVRMLQKLDDENKCLKNENKQLKKENEHLKDESLQKPGAKKDKKPPKRTLKGI